MGNPAGAVQGRRRSCVPFQFKDFYHSLKSVFAIGVSAVAALAVFAASSVSLPASAISKEFVIGTGSPAGVYIRVGSAICKVLSRSQTGELPAHCRAEPTKGSIANLRDLRAGALSLAVAQSDAQFFATQGKGPFATNGPDETLRSLFSVHAEPFTVVARRDSGIRLFQDLPGKRVNLGNPGSGQRATMEALMAVMGWTVDDFALADGLPASQQSLALCHDRFQAMVYTVGHPNPSVEKAVSLCDANIVPVEGTLIERYIADKPYFTSMEIPGGIYPGIETSVPTFGVLATVVASSKTPPETVYFVVRSVFDNFDLFRAVHPVLTTLEAQKMIKDGLTAPLHDGARRYYLEKGWLNP